MNIRLLHIRMIEKVFEQRRILSIENNIMSKHRKRRTRTHIIADLSVNHVEYFALKCGFSVERIESDYGYDLQIYSYDENGEFENGLIYLQLKATDNIGRYTRQAGYSYPLEKEHLEIWINEPMPVIIVLYDAVNEKAYWIYLQAYFEKERMNLNSDQNTFSLYLGKDNVISIEAIKKWKTYKDDILSQLDGKVKHYAQTSEL